MTVSTLTSYTQVYRQQVAGRYPAASLGAVGRLLYIAGNLAIIATAPVQSAIPKTNQFRGESK